MTFENLPPRQPSRTCFKDDARHKYLLACLAAAVPGEVRGLEYIHKKYGVSQTLDLYLQVFRSYLQVLPWKTVMQGSYPRRSERLRGEHGTTTPTNGCGTTQTDMANRHRRTWRGAFEQQSRWDTTFFSTRRLGLRFRTKRSVQLLNGSLASPRLLTLFQAPC